MILAPLSTHSVKLVGTQRTLVSESRYSFPPGGTRHETNSKLRDSSRWQNSSRNLQFFFLLPLTFRSDSDSLCIRLVLHPLCSSLDCNLQLRLHISIPSIPSRPAQRRAVSAQKHHRHTLPSAWNHRPMIAAVSLVSLVLSLPIPSGCGQCPCHPGEEISAHSV